MQHFSSQILAADSNQRGRSNRPPGPSNHGPFSQNQQYQQSSFQQGRPNYNQNGPPQDNRQDYRGQQPHQPRQYNQSNYNQQQRGGNWNNQEQPYRGNSRVNQNYQNYNSQQSRDNYSNDRGQGNRGYQQDRGTYNNSQNNYGGHDSFQQRGEHQGGHNRGGFQQRNQRGPRPFNNNQWEQGNYSQPQNQYNDPYAPQIEEQYPHFEQPHQPTYDMMSEQSQQNPPYQRQYNGPRSNDYQGDRGGFRQLGGYNQRNDRGGYNQRGFSQDSRGQGGYQRRGYDDRDRAPAKRQLSQGDLFQVLTQRNNIDVENHKLLQIPNEVRANPQRNYLLPEQPKPLGDRANLDPIKNFEGAKKIDLTKFRGQPEPFFVLPEFQSNQPEQSVKGFKDATGINFDEFQRLGAQLSTQIVANFDAIFK